MIGEMVGYVAAAATAVAAVVFGFRREKREDTTSVTARLATVESRYDAISARVQILERREVWHERKQSILMETLEENGIPVPAMPPAPEVYPS